MDILRHSSYSNLYNIKEKKENVVDNFISYSNFRWINVVLWYATGKRGRPRSFSICTMCHFSQLHVRLPLDDFTMGVLRALNVAPT